MGTVAVIAAFLYGGWLMAHAEEMFTSREPTEDDKIDAAVAADVYFLNHPNH